MVQALAHDVLAATLTQVVYSTLLFCVAWIVSSLLGHRLPHLRLVLWLLVLIRLVLPAGLFSPWSIGAIASELDSRHALQLPIVSSERAQQPPTIAASHEVPGRALWPLGLAIVWLTGFTLSFRSWRRARIRRFDSLGVEKEPAPSELLDLLEQWRRRLGIRRLVRVRLSSAISTPFTFGIVRPTICLPAGVARRIEPRELSVVIGHELAHVKRLDDLWLRAETLLRCIYFFHPVAWMATARLAELREQLADELTLRASAITGRDYAKVLLRWLSLEQEPCAAPAFGAHSAVVFERRVRNLLGLRGSRRRTIAVSLGVAAGLFLLPMAPASPEKLTVTEAENLTLDHPLPASRITSPFGPRRDPFSSSTTEHRGIDLAAPRGTRVLAPASGTVVLASETYAPSPDQGSVVILEHAGGIATFYSHLDRILVSSGERVTRGQTIGLVGSTGRVTGPHLHFELWTPEGPSDPSVMIPGLRAH